MVYTVIAILLLIYSVKNYKRAFFLYLLLEIVWYPQAKIVNIETIPSIPIYLFTSLAFFLLFLLGKSKKGNIKSRVPFPYMVPLLIIAIVKFLSSFTAYAGFSDQFARALGFLFHEVIEVWLLWRMVESKRDFRFLLRGFLIVFFIVSIYGLFEYSIQYNPIAEYKRTLTPQGFRIYFAGTSRGYRLMSMFEHPIGAGMTMGLFCIFVLCLYINDKKELPSITMTIISVVASIVCIIFTKMRSGLVFTTIAALSLVKIKKIRTYGVILALITAIVILYPLLSEYIFILQSLFNLDAQNVAGGSSLSMRLVQFQGSLNLMNMSPILGLGENFENYVSSIYLQKTGMLESVILETMVCHGILGLISQAVFLWYSLVTIPKHYKCTEAFFIALAYWVTYIFTSIPSFRMIFLYFVLFYFIKGTDVYRIEFESNKLTNVRKKVLPFKRTNRNNKVKI